MPKQVMRALTLCILFCCTFTSGYASQQLVIEPDAGRAPLLQAIQQAHTLNVVMYGLTDPAFTTALVNATKQQKIVQVLLQHYPYKAENENSNAISALQTAHVPLHWPSHIFKLTHEKSILLDNRTAFIMTFNLTRSTFSKERNFALRITDPDIIREMQQVFAADWQQVGVTVHHPHLLWSPDNSREKIVALLQQAKKDIRIYAEGLNDYQMVGLLAKAARQGVSVTILTSSYDNKPISKQFSYLAKNGVRILYSNDYVIHAKVIIIDEQRALLGSINLTRQSINDNRELAIVTEDPAVIHELIQTFTRDAKHTSLAAATPQHEPSPALAAELREVIKLGRRYYRHLMHHPHATA